MTLALPAKISLLKYSCLLVCVLACCAQAKDINVDFKNKDIQEVIRMASDVSGKIMIVDPRVKGRVTVTSPKPIDEKQFYELFLRLLDAHGFTAVENDGIVTIMPNKEAPASPLPVTGQ